MLRDIFDVGVSIKMAQQPIEHVEHDHRARIADMGEVIDRRPAHIHAHALRIERGEDPLFLRERIVELELHENVVPGRLLARALLYLMEKRRPQPAFGASE
jgi:hypothetical protein